MTIVKAVLDASGNEMKAELVPAEKVSELEHLNAQQGLKELEDTLFEKAFEVTSAAMQYADMPWDWQAPSDEWIRELGKERAWRKFRMIKAGQLPQSHAPAGLKVATAIAMSAMKNRAVQRGPQLAINIVQLTQEPERKYPEQVIDE